MNLQQKKDKIREVVEKAIKAVKDAGRQVAPGTWGDAESSKPVCLVGAIGVLYNENEWLGELNVSSVAPLIKNGAAGVIDDTVLAGLSAGFENRDEDDYFYGGWYYGYWDDNDEFKERFRIRVEENEELYMFAYNLGCEIRANYDAEYEDF